MDQESTRLHLSSLRALWGHVTPSLRAASIQKDGSTIRWRCVFDVEATDEDFELARIAGAEILADFSSPVDIDEQVLVTPSPEKPEHLNYLIYLRHE